MYTERRRKQLEKNGVNISQVESFAEDFVRQMKDAEMSIQEGCLVTKRMDCILSEMIRCSPNSKIE